MKNKTLRVCMLFLIPVLWFSCTEETVVKEEKNVEKVIYENINARDDAHLMKILQGFNPSGSSNGRTQSFDFGEVKLSEAIKVENPYKDIVRYSLILSTDPADPGFENVVLRDHKGEIYPYITRYEPDKDWLMEKGGKFETRTFTGTLKVLDINRTLLVEVAFNNGRGTEIGNYIKKNGRTECDDDGGGSTGGGSGGGGSGSGTGGNTGGGTGGDYGGGTGGSTGGSTGGGSTGGGPTGSGSTDGSSGGGGSDCEWGTSSTTGGLFIDCRAVDMGLYFFRTACDGGDFNDINLCDDPEFAATYSEACGEDPIGILAEEKILSVLNNLIEQDPFLLIDNCEQIENWKTLAQHTPSQEVIDKLKEIDLNTVGVVDVQGIQDASGAIVNMDFFPVTITKLPIDPETGQEFTAEGFLGYIRKNINDFLNTDLSEFAPSTITGFDEAELWNSNDPIGAILHINISGPAGDGSVICSDFSNENWIFTTIEVPYDMFQFYDGKHPVSGNREFGYIANNDGSYTFFTRGVDRITTSFDAGMADLIPFVEPFDQPDELWNSFKSGVYDFVENNSGDANNLSAEDNIIERPNWEEVKEVLLGQKPISELGCDN